MAQGQVNSETQGGEVYPSVAMDTTGNFVVVWQDGYHPFENSGASIHGQRYDANGSAVGTQFRVNTVTTGDQLNPSVAVDADGDFVVVWESNGSSGSDTDSTSIQGQRYAGPPSEPPTVVPALSPSGLIALVALLLGAGALLLRGRLRLAN